MTVDTELAVSLLGEELKAGQLRANPAKVHLFLVLPSRYG